MSSLQVFSHYEKLLHSDNYVTRRQSLKLLGELLLDRHNFSVSIFAFGVIYEWRHNYSPYTFSVTSFVYNHWKHRLRVLKYAWIHCKIFLWAFFQLGSSTYLYEELPLDFSKAPSAKLSTLNTCLPKNNVDKNSTFQKNEHFLRCWKLFLSLIFDKLIQLFQVSIKFIKAFLCKLFGLGNNHGYFGKVICLDKISSFCLKVCKKIKNRKIFKIVNGTLLGDDSIHFESWQPETDDEHAKREISKHPIWSVSRF